MSRYTARCCFIPGCSEYKRRKLSLFKVPKDPERFKKWQNSISHIHKYFQEKSALCELHFEERFIQRNFVHNIHGESVSILRGRPVLSSDAIPTLLINMPASSSVSLPQKRKSGESFLQNVNVCELHFKETDFEREISAYDSKTGETLTAPLHVKRLKKGVVPSLHINSKAPKSTYSSSRETPEQKRSQLEKEQLNLAFVQSLKSVPCENSLTEDTTETSSHSRATENEATNSDNKVCSSKDLNGFTGISYSVQQSPNQSINASCSDLVNDSTLSLQNVQINEEKPWEEEYNYTVNASLNSDTVKITSVQSCASNQNESDVPSQQETSGKPAGCGTTFYKKPLLIDKRDEAFGKFVACEMSDLRTNPELYLKTQQSILKILVEAHFEQMCANNVA